jgi:hypothetical protein
MPVVERRSRDHAIEEGRAPVAGGVEEPGVQLAQQQARRVGGQRDVPQQREGGAGREVQTGVDRVHAPGVEPEHGPRRVVDAMEAPQPAVTMHRAMDGIGSDLGGHHETEEARPVGRPAGIVERRSVRREPGRHGRREHRAGGGQRDGHGCPAPSRARSTGHPLDRGHHRRSQGQEHGQVPRRGDDQRHDQYASKLSVAPMITYANTAAITRQETTAPVLTTRAAIRQALEERGVSCDADDSVGGMARARLPAPCRCRRTTIRALARRSSPRPCQRDLLARGGRDTLARASVRGRDPGSAPRLPARSRTPSGPSRSAAASSRSRVARRTSWACCRSRRSCRACSPASSPRAAPATCWRDEGSRSPPGRGAADRKTAAASRARQRPARAFHSRSARTRPIAVTGSIAPGQAYQLDGEAAAALPRAGKRLPNTSAWTAVPT